MQHWLAEQGESPVCVAVGDQVSMKNVIFVYFNVGILQVFGDEAAMKAALVVIQTKLNEKSDVWIPSGVPSPPSRIWCLMHKNRAILVS